MTRHARLWSRRSSAKDLGTASTAAPRHRAAVAHEHTYILIAEFPGRRASISECWGKLDTGEICGQTMTAWAPCLSV